MTVNETEKQAVTEETAAPKEEKKKKKPSAAETALKEENEQLQTALAESKDQYQRMLAEYANYKRRTEQEKEQIGAFVKADILTRLLTSLDNMDRAMEAPAGDEYKTGVELTMRQFKDALQKLGLEEIDALGQPFDPSVHNAVMREDAEDVETETVTEVFQKGYKLGDRVLRPAMVKVAN
jgi:molecular chaperone GrpE